MLGSTGTRGRRTTESGESTVYGSRDVRAVGFVGLWSRDRRV